jgi:hypothetical protein
MKYFYTVSIFILLLLLSCTDLEPEREPTPEEERAEMIARQFHPWDGSHIVLERFVKSRLNDPSSFQHQSTQHYDLGEKVFVLMHYRAANAFGALVRAKISIEAHPESGEILRVRMSE